MEDRILRKARNGNNRDAEIPKLGSRGPSNCHHLEHASLASMAESTPQGRSAEPHVFPLAAPSQFVTSISSSEAYVHLVHFCVSSTLCLVVGAPFMPGDGILNDQVNK